MREFKTKYFSEYKNVLQTNCNSKSHININGKLSCINNLFEIIVIFKVIKLTTKQFIIL